METLSEQTKYVKDELKEQGGIRRLLQNIRSETQNRIMIATTPNAINEIVELIESTFPLYLENIAELDENRKKLFDMPDIMMTFAASPSDNPLYKPVNIKDEEKRVVVVKNKAFACVLERELEKTGWKKIKEYSYPLIGGVQSWTKTDNGLLI